jgi:serine/threonine-protein kinase
MAPDDVKIKKIQKFIIAEGGFSHVYRASMRVRVKGKDDVWTEVACKVLKGAIARDAKALALFAKEVGVLCSFKHPNICRAYGGWMAVDEDEDLYPTLVLEILPYSLADLLWPKAASANLPHLNDDSKLSILRQVAEVLAFLHNRYPQIIHCDIKPENILLTLTLVPKLCDFGIAKEIATSLRLTYGSTGTAGVRGTSAYIVCGDCLILYKKYFNCIILGT